MAGHFHCKSVSFGTGKSNKTFLQPGPDFVGVSRGIQRRHPVRKTKLLSTAAMALLLSAGAVSAQGMGKEPPERAPAAQQTAPAEKVAPSMKAGDQKSPQTTGQATPDSKATGKAPETTGQSPKSEAPDKAGAMDKDKSSAPGKADVRSKSERTAARPKSTQSTTAAEPLEHPLARALLPGSAKTVDPSSARKIPRSSRSTKSSRPS
jgi:hypothetical protein